MLSVSFWTGWKRRTMSSLWLELRLISLTIKWELKHTNIFSGASLDDRPKAFEPDKVSESYCWQKLKIWFRPKTIIDWSEIAFQWSWILEMQDWGRTSPASMPQVFCSNSLLAYYSCCFVDYFLLHICSQHPKVTFLTVFSTKKSQILNIKDTIIKRITYHEIFLNTFVDNLFSIYDSKKMSVGILLSRMK